MLERVIRFVSKNKAGKLYFPPQSAILFVDDSVVDFSVVKAGAEHEEALSNWRG
ncbi:hypothetical protein SAMN02745243_02864 [Hespellia stercorisuis DSM 15480]|uniref:Uncharacterized protein n=1 Tax=Hespellia stercorisuis DSM 15480 TaxID=1121950 RepID=A0A1M6S762_9FIRM|nr:hypothetical protein SAMN02745243_02864 [Hespellia stercorisuis DSM 15480]